MYQHCNSVYWYSCPAARPRGHGIGWRLPAAERLTAAAAAWLAMAWGAKVRSVAALEPRRKVQPGRCPSVEHAREEARLVSEAKLLRMVVAARTTSPATLAHGSSRGPVGGDG